MEMAKQEPSKQRCTDNLEILARKTEELTNITPWAVGFSFGLHDLCTRNGQTGEKNRFRVVAAIDILIDTVTFWHPPSRRGDQCGSRLR